MDDLNVGQVLRNLDERIMHIEQILPTLATRDDMRESIREAIQAAVEPLATREELRAVAEEGKRHTTVLFEFLRDDIRLLAEHVVGLMNRPSG